MTLIRRMETGMATYGDARLLVMMLTEAEEALRGAINQITNAEEAARLMRVQSRLREVLHEQD